MDKLSDVPLSDTEISEKEKEILDKYFSGNTVEEKSNSLMNIIYIAIAFIILSNPWIDSILSKIPYCPDNKLILLLIKTVIFLIVLFIIQKYF